MTEHAEPSQEEPGATPDFDGLYVEVEPLSKSWLAQAYAATDARTNERVFLKVLRESRKDDAQAYQLFCQEPPLLRLLARQVPRLPLPIVLATGHWRERPYFTQPFLTGWSLLEAMCKRSAFTGQAVLRVLEGCLEFLELLHGAGITHGDISPDNIFIETDAPLREDGTLPEQFTVRLLDFNSARRMEGADNQSDSTLFVKLRYAAPELFHRTPHSARSDLFALGVVCYEMLTGERPYNPASLNEAMQLQHATPPAIPLVCEVPGLIEAFLRRLLAAKPADRPTSASECLRYLRTLREIHRWLSQERAPDVSAFHLRPDAPRDASDPQNVERLNDRQQDYYVRNSPTVPVPPRPRTLTHEVSLPQPSYEARHSTGAVPPVKLGASAPSTKPEMLHHDMKPPLVRDIEVGSLFPPPPERAGAGSGTELGRGVRDEVSAIFDVPVPRQGAGFELAQFSVFSPASIRPDSTFILEVWAYLGRERDEVLKRATRHGRLIERGSRGPVRLPSQTEITLVLRLDGFEIQEPQDTFFWCGDITNVPFMVKAPADLRLGIYPGQIKILHNGLLLSKLLFDVMVGELGGEAAVLSVRRDQVTSAFASYASADREEVLRRVQGIRAAGIDVFLDMVSLHTGQDWQQQLLYNIRSRDIFYLFWSVAASQSMWVDREWRYALLEKGLDYIHPIPLEDPRLAPPPAELASKHFNDLILACIKSQAVLQDTSR